MVLTMWCNEFVIVVEEPGVSATAPLPKNHCSEEDTRRVRAVTKPNGEESCEKPHRGKICYVIMCFPITRL